MMLVMMLTGQVIDHRRVQQSVKQKKACGIEGCSEMYHQAADLIVEETKARMRAWTLVSVVMFFKQLVDTGGEAGHFPG